MLDTYFFVPAKRKFLDNIDAVHADFIIIDLEDSISNDMKIHAYELAMKITPKENFFVRVPFFENCFSIEQLKKIVGHFNGNIVVPKTNDSMDLKKVSEFTETCLNMIVLVENPLGIFNLSEILQTHSHQIHGVGFGSHDFCSVTGIKHTFENLIQYKKNLIFISKVFNVKYIDNVDLDLLNLDNLEKECVFAFENGADGKFLIHPIQLDKLKSVRYLDESFIQEVYKVIEYITSLPENSIDIIKIEGRIYEKPHIARIKKLFNKLTNGAK